MSKELAEELRDIADLTNWEVMIREAADLLEAQQSWIASLEQNARDADRMYKELETELAEAQKRIEELLNKLDKRNEMLTESSTRWQEMEQQLAAAQAHIKVLREAYVLLENFASSVGGSSDFWEHFNDQLEPASVIANFGQTDDSALRELLKAERERCAKVCDRKKKEFAEAFKDMADESLGAGQCAAAIRAMEDQ